MLSLAGKGAIVAGTRRIGAAIVDRLADEGVNVAVIYRGSRDEAERQVEAARKKGVNACSLQADLTDETEVQQAVAKAKEALGNISFCINLASNYPRVSFEQLNASAWDEGMSVARGSFLLATHASRVMLQNPENIRGHLIFFGDWAAEETPYRDYLPYLTGKAAVHFMTRAFALELAPQGILVNAVLPGPTARPAEINDSDWQDTLRQVPLGKESSSEDIVNLIDAMLRLETMTGETIRVDAGRHLAGSIQEHE